MRLKIRSPSGTNVLEVGDDATVTTLSTQIRTAAGIPSGTPLDIKYGYPPRSLHLDTYPGNTMLATLPVKLEGEQLIVSAVGGRGPTKSQSPSNSASTSTRTSTSASSAPFSFASGAERQAPSKPLNLTRAAPTINLKDPPTVYIKGRGTVVLRVMEDDNSCLFRALSYVMGRSMVSVDELRQLVAGTIQENPNTYSAAVLEQEPDKYCEWIKRDSSWGGGIELGIMADFFDIEVSLMRGVRTWRGGWLILGGRLRPSMCPQAT